MKTTDYVRCLCIDFCKVIDIVNKSLFVCTCPNESIPASFLSNQSR